MDYVDELERSDLNWRQQRTKPVIAKRKFFKFTDYGGRDATYHSIERFLKDKFLLLLATGVNFVYVKYMDRI
jgi:hypothetical protein